MAIQFPNFLGAAGAPANYSGLANIFENALKGYKMQKEPEKMKQEALVRALQAKILGSTAKYADPLAEAKLGLLGAQAGGAKADSQKKLAAASLLSHYLSQWQADESGNGAGGIVHEGNGSGYIGPQTPGSGESNYSNQGPVPGGMSSPGQGGGDYSESDKGMNPNGFDVGSVNDDGFGSSSGAGSTQQQRPQQSNPRQQSGMDYFQTALVNQALGMKTPIVDVDGTKMVFGPRGPVVVAKGLTPVEKARMEGFAKSDVKAAEDIQKTSLSGIESKPTMDELAKVVSDPAWKSMRTNELAPKLEMTYYLKKGTPEQKALAGRFMTYSNQLIKDSAKDFTGPFRVGEQGILEKMKPSENDTLPVAQAKLQALITLREARSKRAEKAYSLIRKQGMDPSEAMRIADKELDMDKIREDARKQVSSKELSQSRMKTQMKGSQPAGTVRIKTPDGHIVFVPDDNVKEALMAGGRYA